jgi:hypothetical protein
MDESARLMISNTGFPQASCIAFLKGGMLVHSNTMNRNSGSAAAKATAWALSSSSAFSTSRQGAVPGGIFPGKPG